MKGNYIKYNLARGLKKKCHRVWGRAAMQLSIISAHLCSDCQSWDTPGLRNSPETMEGLKKVSHERHGIDIIFPPSLLLPHF